MNSTPAESARSRTHDSLFDAYMEPEWKTPGWLSSPAKDTAAEQYAHARGLEEAGKLGRACSEYDALVCQWPSVPEAPLAQIRLAHVLERRDKKADAFREYQYAILMYPNAIDYEGAVQSQWELLGAMEGELGTGFLGFGETLGAEEIAQLYQVVAKNSPAHERAPESYFRMGELYAGKHSKSYDLALEPYDTVVARYPQSEWAPRAASAAARARALLSRTYPRDVKRARAALHSLNSVLQTYAGELSKEEGVVEELGAWREEVSERLTEEEFQQAEFYDTIRHRPDSARTAYRRFLELHPTGPHAERARKRLGELEVSVRKAP